MLFKIWLTSENKGDNQNDEETTEETHSEGRPGQSRLSRAEKTQNYCI